MKYFFDTEFLEGPQDKRFLSIKYGETKPTIDLISIGIVAEDGREYYAISKDFNLEEAWNRYQVEYDFGKPQGLGDKKVYWIRENVLMQIHYDLVIESGVIEKHDLNFKEWKRIITLKDKGVYTDRHLPDLKKLIAKYGKSNEEIADQVKFFCNYAKVNESTDGKTTNYDWTETDPEFYAYFADYDWVVFCWLFGSMMDLPKGFPMYCRDLKQELDRVADSLTRKDLSKLAYPNVSHNVFGSKVLKATNSELLKSAESYPKQTNKHNALADARWDFELYKFLEKL